MHAEKVLVEGNAFPGLFARSSDKITLTGMVPEKFASSMERVLKTRVARIGLCGSSLCGIFSVINSTGIIVPHLALSSEIAQLKKLGLNVLALKGRHSAVGNNLIANDRGAIANPRMDKKTLKLAADALGVEITQMEIAGHQTVGSVCIATNRGFLAHHNTRDDELEKIESALRVKGGIGTLDMGVPFVGLCAVANSSGFVVGEPTSGFELARMDEALGFAGH